MPGPLDGYRVIDLTSMVSGPLATMMLGDQGADVIKVESLGQGDHTRTGSNRSNGLSSGFLNVNRNKRSIAVNLKDPRGRGAVIRLVETADVFIQNFRPGVVERLGVGEPDIRAVNAGIVYVSINGFGETGPYAHKRVYDPIIQAASGLASVQGGSDDARPRLVRTILPDKLTGVTAAQAVTAALLARERTGEGQHVRLSMLDAVVSFLWASDMGGQTFLEQPATEQRAASFIDLIYETKDGHMSVAVMSDGEWIGLTRALERPEWLEGRTLRDARAPRREYRRSPHPHPGGATRKDHRRVDGAPGGRGRALRAGADPERARRAPAGCRRRHARRSRSSRRRKAAPGQARGALRGDAERDPAGRAAPRRAYGRAARRGRACRRRDRRVARRRRRRLSPA